MCLQDFNISKPTPFHFVQEIFWDEEIPAAEGRGERACCLRCKSGRKFSVVEVNWKLFKGNTTPMLSGRKRLDQTRPQDIFKRRKGRNAFMDGNGGWMGSFTKSEPPLNFYGKSRDWVWIVSPLFFWQGWEIGDTVTECENWKWPLILFCVYMWLCCLV